MMVMIVMMSCTKEPEHLTLYLNLIEVAKVLVQVRQSLFPHLCPVSKRREVGRVLE